MVFVGIVLPRMVVLLWLGVRVVVVLRLGRVV